MREECVCDGGEGGRTALDIVMVSLCAEVIKVGQTVQSDGLQLFWGNFTIPVAIDSLQDGVDDVICFVLVLDVILRNVGDV